LHDDAFFNTAPQHWSRSRVPVHITREHGLFILTGGKIEKLCSPVNTDCQHGPCSGMQYRFHGPCSQVVWTGSHNTTQITPVFTSHEDWP